MRYTQKKKKNRMVYLGVLKPGGRRREGLGRFGYSDDDDDDDDRIMFFSPFSLFFFLHCLSVGEYEKDQ